MQFTQKIGRVFFFAILAGVICFIAYLGITIYRISESRSEIKKDFSIVNSIHNGLFSVDVWRDHMLRILTVKIDSFSFSPAQEELLKQEINGVLNSMIQEAENIVSNQTGLKGKIKKTAINIFVDWDSLRARIPAFSELILDEVRKPQTRESLKLIMREKLQEYATEIYEDDPYTDVMQSIYAKYDVPDKIKFIEHTDVIINEMRKEAYTYTYCIVAIMLLFLLIWFFIRRINAVKQYYFIFCVALGIVVLFISLNIPMLEIDARIDNLDFSLLGDTLQFDDQILFLQSKSILDVVIILIETKKADSILVGILILAFSVLFPVAKLIATQIYIVSKKMRHNKVVRYLAFHSGKWSMADVMVIAIFMAYVGFKAILNDQLTYLNVQTDTMTSVATNNTHLQPGFILFLSFVIFSLIISELLKKFTLSKIDMQELRNREISAETDAPWKTGEEAD